LRRPCPCDRCRIDRWQRCGGLHEQPRELPGSRQRRWRAVIGQPWIGWRPPAPSVWRGPGRRLASFAEPTPHQPCCAGEASRLQRPPQHGATLAAFGTPRLQMREMLVNDAVAGATCATFRKARGRGVVAHRSARQLHGTRDRDQRFACGLPALHLAIQGKATLAAVRATLFVRGTARERPGASGRHGVATVADGAGTLRRAVACDHLDPWPLPQPAGQRRRSAVGQETDHAAPLQVDDDRAVAASAALPLRRHSTRFASGTLTGSAQSSTPMTRGLVRQRQPVEQARHGVGAGRHGQPGQQPRARFAAQRSARPALRLGQPARAPGEGRHQLRHAFGKGSARTGGVAAVEPAHAQTDPNRPPE